MRINFNFNADTIRFNFGGCLVALPDSFKRAVGTALVWKDSGGDNTLTLIGLANGSARMGASDDLGEFWNRDYMLFLDAEFAAAPTAGLSVSVFMACSHDDSRFPAGVSGSDAAWPADGNEDEWAKQLTAPDLVLITTNDGAGTVQYQQPWIWRPTGRYVAPVVDNNSGQAFHGSNTNSRLVVVPILDTIED